MQLYQSEKSQPIPQLENGKLDQRKNKPNLVPGIKHLDLIDRSSLIGTDNSDENYVPRL